MKTRKKIILIIGIILLVGIFFSTYSSKKTIVVKANNNIILLKGKRQISTRIKDATSIYQIDDKFLLYYKKQKLYIYNIKSKKSKCITKSFTQIQDYNSQYIIYSMGNNTYIYNIKSNKIQKLNNINFLSISENKKNLIYRKNNIFTIYNLNNKKELIKIKNVDNYKCINKSCTDFYYIELNHLKRYHKREIDLKQSISNILYQEKDILVFENQKNGEYVLYYKKGSRKAIKLDTNKRPHQQVMLNKNMIVYLTGGNCKEVKKNGRRKRIIARNIDKIVEVYRKKYLLIKNQSLYLNDKLLDKKIEEDTITIIGNKIYYLRKNKEIYELIENTSKKSKILNSNVKEMKKINNRLYYLGDYNLYRQYGNIYLANSKKTILEKVNYIIENDIK